MIYTQCNFFSKVLQNHVDVNVLLPCMEEVESLSQELDVIYQKREMPALYLLHGALEDHTGWMRNTNVERYAAKAQTAVVMPSGQNGFYTNAKYGLRYFDFICEELPRFIEYTFPVSKKRKDRYIAGASMGGYGAAKCALSCPDRYAAFGNFSGAVDPVELEEKMTKQGLTFFRYDLVFGGTKQIAGTKDDLFCLIENSPQGGKLPAALIACAQEDENNYVMNQRLARALQEKGADIRFLGGKGGHDWAYWDICISSFMEMIGMGNW